MKDILIRKSVGHGKCVAGRKRTATIQVQDYSKTATGFMLLKQFRYVVSDPESYRKALAKAEAFKAALETRPLP